MAYYQYLYANNLFFVVARIKCRHTPSEFRKKNKVFTAIGCELFVMPNSHISTQPNIFTNKHTPTNQTRHAQSKMSLISICMHLEQLISRCSGWLPDGWTRFNCRQDNFSLSLSLSIFLPKCKSALNNSQPPLNAPTVRRSITKVTPNSSLVLT